MVGFSEKMTSNLRPECEVQLYQAKRKVSVFQEEERTCGEVQRLGESPVCLRSEKTSSKEFGREMKS